MILPIPITQHRRSPETVEIKLAPMSEDDIENLHKTLTSSDFYLWVGLSILSCYLVISFIIIIANYEDIKSLEDVKELIGIADVERVVKKLIKRRNNYDKKINIS